MDKNLDLSNVGIVYNSEIEGSKDFAARVSCCFFENKLTTRSEVRHVGKEC